MGAAVPDGHRGSLFLVRAGEVKGVEGRGRQDKGNASGHCLNGCLHVFFHGGMVRWCEQELLTRPSARMDRRHVG